MRVGTPRRPHEKIPTLFARETPDSLPQLPIPGCGRRTGLSPIRKVGGPMRTTKQLSISLPTGMAHALKERVTSGVYASESEVVHGGLRALFARGQADRCCLTKLIRNVFQHERFSGRPH